MSISNIKPSLLIYRDSNEHLRDELRRLDLLIMRQVLAMRLESRLKPQGTAAAGIYISHEEVDWLLNKDVLDTSENPEIQRIHTDVENQECRIRNACIESERQGVVLPLFDLSRTFALSPIEIQIVVLCLAPELDRKYDTLYAYLQDDITRKKPTIDLAAHLFCSSVDRRWAFSANILGPSPLFSAGILQKSDDPQSPSGSSGLAQFMKLDPRILCMLLGNNTVDIWLSRYVKLIDSRVSIKQVLVDDRIKDSLCGLVDMFHRTEKHNSAGKKVIIHLYGPHGSGKQDLARALCSRLGSPLLALDAELLPVATHEKEEILRLSFRESALLHAPLYIYGIDNLFDDENSARSFLKNLALKISESGFPIVFFSGEKTFTHNSIFEPSLYLPVNVPVPGISIRKEAWGRALLSIGHNDINGWSEIIADRFQLTPGLIFSAAQSAMLTQTFKDPQDLILADLFKACRERQTVNLTELAVKVESRYVWNDLVLPIDNIAQLREICAQVRNRRRVHDEWGFGSKFSHGKGLSVLFSGPSGTGKTMAAEVIASELQLDLYKIDLSGIVSKYIGETEKNLSKIFREAESSNAILFFDEADALFGKRTEVSDAHDRYANIETSYLLQKIELYEGIVILATNLRGNMDDAFIRRIRFIIEFPFPDESSRAEIWRKHFPHSAPISETVDYNCLARQFQVAGGNIKNIVLNAAFLAADNGGVITMSHLYHGAKREFEKIGKSWHE